MAMVIIPPMKTTTTRMAMAMTMITEIGGGVDGQTAETNLPTLTRDDDDDDGEEDGGLRNRIEALRAKKIDGGATNTTNSAEADPCPPPPDPKQQCT